MAKRTTAGETADQLDEAALAWALRVHDEGLDPERDPELAGWLARDHRRAGALLRAQAALSLLDRSRALAGHPDPDLALAARPATRRALIGSAAAGVVAVVAAGVRLSASRGRRYRTELGEIRNVPLADGSTAVINTRSELTVAMDHGLRTLRLIDGEAWFDVAKDPARPFQVAAGRIIVRAVGTAFSVRKLDGGAEVMVTEGVVDSWIAGAEQARLRIKAGSRTSITSKARPTVVAAAAQIQRDLAWRAGEISLDGETLAQAAGEFNRYNRRLLVIEDPALASQRFVGLFRTNDPGGFAAAVAAATGAQVREDEKAIHVGRMT